MKSLSHPTRQRVKFNGPQAAVWLYLIFAGLASSNLLHADDDPPLPKVVKITKYIRPAILSFPVKQEELKVNDKLEGAVTFSAPDGRLMMVVPYLNDQLHGMFTQYYPDGTKRMEESYVAGVKHGDTRVWTKDGHLLVRMSHIHGQLHGKQEHYFLNGERASISRFHSGKNHGSLLEFKLDGQISIRGQFDMGTVIEEDFVDEREERDQKASKQAIAEQQRDFLEYWKNESFATEESGNNMADSEVVLKEKWMTETRSIPASEALPFPAKVVKFTTSESAFGVVTVLDQEDRVMSEVMTLDGVQHGRAIFYWPNGKVHSELDHVQGVAHGESNFYDPQGRKLSTGTVCQGLQYGLNTDFYSTGEKSTWAALCAGEQQGTMQGFTRSGQLAFVIDYEDGRRVRKEDFIEISEWELADIKNQSSYSEKTIVDVWAEQHGGR